ncbi:PrsW family intramembrane metalloprotease [Microbacterium sp. KSW4-11]|uniref:PrsW family intramembrane metalloprotease n=1 Tax=Microbacterium gawkjiense TaxID=3067309 RepID=A0ABU3G642_9MICO|nr:PrsW family intramembrane metalloprotease [Microbacterium sp. KSW4-11]MDT3315280.1 PrsW family intramembrane metalloprotease [Microbacterium sp. KSW4-11]
MSFPSPLAQPTHSMPATPPPAPPRRDLPVPTPGAGRTVLWIVGIVLVLVALGLAAYFLTFLGPVAAVVAGVLALVPLALVLVAVRIIDRWEPEPRGLVVFALAWGAVASVALTLAVDLVIGLVVPQVPETLSAVVQAPIVEEFAKGAGVLLVFVAARRAFDGPVDGVVYGALVGAGFAFTENILYFADSLITEGVESAAYTFFLRGVLSPFAHVMFTAVTGYALGRAARIGLRGSAGTPRWLLGIVGAIALHALWNGSAVFADFFALYTTLQVPLFVLFIVGVVLLRREEARLTRARLGDYAAAGWFSPGEVDMLATRAGRARAVAWARTLPGDRSAAMRRFIAEATSLAAARQRVVTGRDPAAAVDERVYLERATRARGDVLAR